MIGHLLAFICVFVWGITFISTKILLQHMDPSDILFIRFFLGYLALWALFPRKGEKYRSKVELFCLLGGFLGTFVYFYLENVALCFTTASNVGVLLCLAPFFTAILSKLIDPQGNTLSKNFFIGLVISFIGVVLICFGGQSVNFNPMGDGLAIIAALAWACYSLVLKRISDFKIPGILSTRKIFGYGLLFIGSAYLFKGGPVTFKTLLLPSVGLNLLFLGLLASAACYVMWTNAVSIIGPGPSTIYIYLSPVVCLICANIVLNERLTTWGLWGSALVLVGLVLSQLSKSALTGIKNYLSDRFVKHRKDDEISAE